MVGGRGLALVEMSKVEQRYRAVLAVRASDRISEVAHRFEVSRQSVHTYDLRHAAVSTWLNGGVPTHRRRGVGRAVHRDPV